MEDIPSLRRQCLAQGLAAVTPSVLSESLAVFTLQQSLKLPKLQIVADA
jgi:hypothetical protein